jgi:AraC-like DNA-binding protein
LTRYIGFKGAQATVKFPEKHMQNPIDTPKRLREQLFLGDIPAFQFFAPWRHVPDTRFFAKDASSRFLFLSRNLLDLNGVSREEDIVGLSDQDFYPRSIAEKFRQDDAQVILTGESLTDMVEIFLDEMGRPEWYVTHKFPIRSRKGEVVGVMGTSRKYGGDSSEVTLFPSLEKAIRHLRENFTEDVPIPVLADMVSMSVRQFQRLFIHFFKMPPSRYRIRMRVLAACDILLRDGRSISGLAHDLGFGDESGFIRHFKSQMGITPLKYRLKYR